MELRRYWQADEGPTGSVPVAASHPCVPTEPPVSGLEAAPPAVRCVRSHGAVNRVVSPLRLFRPLLLGPRRTTRRGIEEIAPWTPAAIGPLCAPKCKLEAKKSRGRERPKRNGSGWQGLRSCAHRLRPNTAHARRHRRQWKCGRRNYRVRFRFTAAMYEYGALETDCSIRRFPIRNQYDNDHRC